MKLASVRLIAADIKVMVSFYEMVTGLPAEWPAPVFAEIVTPAATLAIGAPKLLLCGRSAVASPPPIAPPTSSFRLRISMPNTSV